MITVSHDGFARQSLVRETVKTTCTCSWCGQTKRTGKLFRYGVEPENISCRVNWINGLFCSVGCMRAYNS